MKKAFIFGIGGRMGKVLTERAADFGYTVTGGFDKCDASPYPTFTDTRDINVPFDVIIDFSVPQLLTPLVTLAEEKRVPVVIATTGYNASELKTIELLSKRVPVFRSGNMSLGIAAIKAASVLIKSVLGDSFDIEIVEKHHNQKIDSPSGTAIMLADALAPSENHVTERFGKRNHGELGIVSVRGGTVVGEHEVGFYGDDEIVTVSHSARSRKLFAAGAFAAADLLLSSKPGMYCMDDIVKNITR